MPEIHRETIVWLVVWPEVLMIGTQVILCVFIRLCVTLWSLISACLLHCEETGASHILFPSVSVCSVHKDEDVVLLLDLLFIFGRGFTVVTEKKWSWKQFFPSRWNNLRLVVSRAESSSVTQTRLNPWSGGCNLSETRRYRQVLDTQQGPGSRLHTRLITHTHTHSYTYIHSHTCAWS